MKLSDRWFFIVKLFLILFPVIGKCSRVIDLKRGWFFRNASEATWYPASVPGTVHTDLMSNHLIPDPRTGTNEDSVQWIDTCSWEYKTVFILDSTFTVSRHQVLHFEGLDTYATVYLNDSRILQSDNMFRNFEVDIEGLVRPGENTLVVIFYNAVKRGKQLQQHLFPLPGGERVFTRKAAYQYGWDWSPRLITCGIWKKVFLESWGHTSIRDVQIIQKQLTDSFAILEAVIKVSSDTSATYLVRTEISGDTIPVNFSQTLRPGMNILRIEFAIEKPRRWWSNGLGEPYLYHLKMEGNMFMQEPEVKKLDVGLRTIELVRGKDRVGESFYFKLNGIPVFMKGANWVPPGNFLPEVSEAHKDSLLVSAMESHMNMIRVWGGGAYEDDSFYTACDRLGLLVWQDFMFSGGMYPWDSAFMSNVTEEVQQQVERLRNHPCIALWCGNNEIKEGWFNWGWQKEFHYSVTDSAAIWNGYLELFEKKIPDIIARNDAGRPYWPGSPSIGWGHDESLLSGDLHYWGVWWGMEPISKYNTRVGRFVSEYGFQGMPSPECIRMFGNTEEEPDSVFLKAHQKFQDGYRTMRNYLGKYFPVLSDFHSFCFASGLMQAEALRTAVEAHRRAMPVCMGSLAWQLNDCWPAVSWSTIDITGNWKPAQYALKRSFSTVIISAHLENSQIRVYVVSDSLSGFRGVLHATLMDFNGNVRWQQDRNVAIRYNSSSVQMQIDTALLTHTGSLENCVLVFVLESGKKIADSHYYFSLPVQQQLPESEVSVTYSGELGKLIVESKNVVRNLHIIINGSDLLPDNYFDVLPGKRYELYTGAYQKAPVIRYESLNDLYHDK